jgi:hypothetical protein
MVEELQTTQTSQVEMYGDLLSYRVVSYRRRVPRNYLFTRYSNGCGLGVFNEL